MPQKVFHQIQYLCQQISKVEWSGILFYKTEGSIQDPTTFKIILEDILPLHKGTVSYTEYTFDERVVEYMMENEHLEECRIGHIHSHNTMGVFFSGTDWSELEDNAPNHNYYLSLIVNNFMDFCAKVCFIAEAKNEKFVFEAKDEQGKKYTTYTKEYSVTPKLIVYDCEIDSPKKGIEVGQTFTQKVKSIIEKAERVVTNTARSFSNTTSTKPGEKWSRNTKKEERASWDFWKYPSSKEVKAEEDSFPETLADAIEDFGEDFTLFVINTGNATDEYEDLEELCKFYEGNRVTGSMLAGRVANTLTSSYSKYFETFGEERKDPVLYRKALEEVIYNLECEVLTTRNKMVEKMLEPSLEVVKNILKKFNEVIK